MPAKKQKMGMKPLRRSELAQALKQVLRGRFGVAAGERIGIGVSGGADSVALLLLLIELREELGIVLCIVHFNHQLRGRASDADEKFVANLAARHSLEFLAQRENVAAKAKRERANLEDAARRARYAYFEQLVSAGRLARVAVAHTADDQAETVLAHILRGTGLAGLGGIHPEAGGVFRPLLEMRRADLRRYLREKPQPWREDATNRDTTRTRARIRLRLLPMLEKQFQPATVEHLCQLAELAREDNEYLEMVAANRICEVCPKKEANVAIATQELAPNSGPARLKVAAAGFARGSAAHAGVPAPLAIAKRLVRHLVARAKPQAGELGARHVAAALQLAAQGHSGKVLQLPGGVEVRRERDTLVFRAALGDNRPASPPAFALPVQLPATGGTLRLDTLFRILCVRVIDWPPEGRETTESGAVLDRVRLREPLVLRFWRPGDAMRPAGHQKRHSLARLLNELGRTRWEKESWPVLTSDGKIAWALGLPVAEEFAASEGSRSGVVITEESST
jgi:tRNA(Ile)-lysidine synthase